MEGLYDFSFTRKVERLYDFTHTLEKLALLCGQCVRLALINRYKLKELETDLQELYESRFNEI